MAQRETVLTLLGQGWSKRKIARELGLHRDTVRRYARQARSPGAAAVGALAACSAPALEPKQATLAKVATGSSSPDGAPGAATPGKVATGSSSSDGAPKAATPGKVATASGSAPNPEQDAASKVIAGSRPPDTAPRAATLGEVATGSGSPDAAAEAASLDPVVNASGPVPATKQAAPGKVATGSAQVQAAVAPPPSNTPAAVQTGRSKCEPHQTLIEAKIETGLAAQRIYQDLVAEHGFAGAYNSVKRFVRRLGAGQDLPFRRIECEPGAEAQIDFGTGAPVILGPEGQRQRTHVLRLVLSHSRKAYSEVFFRQTTENLLAGCENAFAAWGGVPRTLVIDNTRAAVRHADWYDPELHPKVSAFCKHYGTVLLPTKPRTPRHKGKIESGIKYIQSNALHGRVFENLAAQNAHLAHWESHVADLRIHGTTKQQVREVFEQIERPALLPLPQARFPFFHEEQRVIHRDGHLEVDKAYYSVPPEYLGRTVWVRWDARMVRVFNAQFVEIALHPKQQCGRFSTSAQHIAAEKISAVEGGATKLLHRVRLIGPQAARWAEAMLKERGIEGVRVLVGLLALVRQHSSTAIERACELAVGHGAFRLREVRALLQEPVEQQQLEFMAEHPVIRSIKAYGELVQVSFREDEPWREPLLEKPIATPAVTEEPGG